MRLRSRTASTAIAALAIVAGGAAAAVAGTGGSDAAQSGTQSGTQSAATQGESTAPAQTTPQEIHPRGGDGDSTRPDRGDGSVRPDRGDCPEGGGPGRGSQEDSEQQDSSEASFT